MDKSRHSTVDCGSFENRIQDLMDQRIDLSQDRPLQEHAAQCSGCKSVLANFRALEQALFVTFDSDSLSLVPEVPNTQPSPAINWSITASIMAIAAVLTIMAVPMFNRESGTISVVKNDVPSVVVTPPTTVEPEASAAITSETESPAAPISLVSYDLPPTLRNAYQYAVELPGIRPIECSLNVTIEALQNSFKAFPQPKQDEKEPDLGHFDAIDQSGLA